MARANLRWTIRYTISVSAAEFQAKHRVLVSEIGLRADDHGTGPNGVLNVLERGAGKLFVALRSEISQRKRAAFAQQQEAVAHLSQRAAAEKWKRNRLVRDAIEDAAGFGIEPQVID